MVGLGCSTVSAPRPLPPWILVAVGLVSGLVGGGLGVGGGFIMVPLLVAAGLGQHRAHATSLAAITLIAASGAAAFAASNEIAVGLGVAAGAGGVVGSAIGASVMHRMRPKTLTVVFAVILLAVAARMITGAAPLPGTAELSGAAQALVLVGIGLVAGFFAGLAGIGGGVVIVPAGVLLLGLGQHEAQGTSLLAIVFTAVAGTIVNLRNKRARLKDGLAAAAGGVVGAVIGAQVALTTEGSALTAAFGVLVLFVALRSLRRALLRRGPAG